MNYPRALFSSIFAIALFSTACDNGVGTGGSGGSGGATSTSNTSTSGSDTTTGASMTTASTSSGGDVCHPDWQDPFCSQAVSCECAPMPAGMPPQAPCPNQEDGDWNTCSPGVNRCGCDLPEGVNYQMPDDTCRGNVSGAVWQTQDGSVQSSAQSEANENGQWTVYFGSAFSPDYPYFKGFVMSGKSLSFNLANKEMLDYCSGDFSPDCKSATLKCRNPAGDLIREDTLVFVSF